MCAWSEFKCLTVTLHARPVATADRREKQFSTGIAKKVTRTSVVFAADICKQTSKNLSKITKTKFDQKTLCKRSSICLLKQETFYSITLFILQTRRKARYICLLYVLPILEESKTDSMCNPLFFRDH